MGGEMWERLSPQARQVMDLARDLAEELGQPYIGDEHVLISLLRQGDSRAADLLRQAGLDPDDAESHLRRLQEQGLTPHRRTDEAAVLASIGIDVEAVRRQLVAAHGADAVGEAVWRASRRPWWRGGGRQQTPLCGPGLFAKRALTYAVEAADARHSDQVSCQDLLDGVLRDLQTDAARGLSRSERRHLDQLGWELPPGHPGLRLLAEHGVDPAELRRRLLPDGPI
jgi:ATP-dependent Clp protease ATP-binding subunit ClpA